MYRVAALIVSLLSLSLVVSHSGRTDASGGHYDRTTGTYHYHHGYPAHDHYDIDGDGIIDCPYDFENEANYSKSENGKYKEKETKNKDGKMERLLDAIISWLASTAIVVAIPIVLFLIFDKGKLIIQWIMSKFNKF